MQKYWGILLSFITIAILSSVFYASLFFGEYITPNINPDPVDEYSFLSDLFMVVITALIAFIAWYQFIRVNQNLKSEYMMKIAEMWRNPEIIEARIVIHRIYLRERNIIESKNPEYMSSSLHEKVAEKIVDLSRSDNDQDVRSFIYLLNFLDFMEVVGQQHLNGKLNIKEVQGIVGLSLKFNYEIFEKYIKDRRVRHEQDKYLADNDFSNKEVFYYGFQNLYNSLL